MPCRSSGKVRMTPSIWALSFSKVPGCTGNFSLSAWVCSKEHSETKMLHPTGWRCSRCKIPGASAGITNKHSHVCCVSKSKVKEGGIQGREKFFIFFYFYFFFNLMDLELKVICPRKKMTFNLSSSWACSGSFQCLHPVLTICTVCFAISDTAQTLQRIKINFCFKWTWMSCFKSVLNCTAPRPERSWVPTA